MGAKKKFGDRKEGRRLRTLDPVSAMIPYIMKTRNDATNYFADSIEITETERFLRQKRTNGYPGMGFLHVFVASYIRTVSQYPGINRFISGQRIFARNNIELVMIVKKELKANAPETSIKVTFSPSDTIDDVYHKLNEEIRKVKENEDTEADGYAKAFIKLPRLILRFAIFMLKVLDYFGKLPKSIINASPFHGSVIITDIGSVGLPAIYHHLYTFGNIPAFITFGAKRRECEPDKDGNINERKYIDYSTSLDERICDGFYFSQAFRMFNSILRNPQMLDQPPETVVQDID